LRDLSPESRALAEQRSARSPTVATPDCNEPVEALLLPHTSQANPLQRQQHATDDEFLSSFAAGVYHNPVTESSQAHTVPRPSPAPVSADDNGRNHYVEDPLPQEQFDRSVEQIPRDRVRTRLRNWIVRMGILERIERAKELYEVVLRTGSGCAGLT
jgi:hypothetical protein